MDNHNIKIIAVRDNPRFDFDVATCVEQHGANSKRCIVKREDVLPSNSPWGKLKDAPDNVFYVDTSTYFCEDSLCRPVVGNILVYRDTDYLTATYAKTLAPILHQDIIDAI